MYTMKQSDHPKILTELLKTLGRSNKGFYSPKMVVKIGNKSVSEIFRLSFSLDDCICFEVSLILLINKINTFPISCILDFLLSSKLLEKFSSNRFWFFGRMEL